MRRTRSLLPVLTTLLAVTTLPARGATPTEITSLSATASGSAITLAGSASFGGQDPVLVGEDAVGDNVGGTQTAGLGLDIVKMHISQPEANVASLVFTLNLGGLQTGGIPEAFQYNWDIMVDGGPEAGGAAWSIKSMRSGQGASGQAGNTSPWASLNTCVQSATGFTCTRQTPDLPVVYDSAKGEVAITVPLARIKAKPGSTIEAWPRNGDPVWVRPSAAGASTPGVTVDGAGHEPYTVPAATVKLGIAPTGAPVDFSAPATVSGRAFSGTLTASQPGSYDVGARACFAGNCATATIPVTLA